MEVIENASDDEQEFSVGIYYSTILYTIVLASQSGGNRIDRDVCSVPYRALSLVERLKMLDSDWTKV